MEQKGHQFIGCGVASCDFNSQKKCTLDSIVVNPSSNCHTGKACDETMCASYRCKNSK